MSFDYFCIFAGGGIRGISYLGALQAFEELNINITGMSGSSVGAIFASLCAVGFTYDEIKEIAFNTNYELFSDLNFKLGKNFGICKGDSFLSYFRELIEKKYYGEQYDPRENSPVRFKDVDKELVIIATNLSNAACKVYSKIETPDEEIAQAVRASISIPGFFKPVWNNDECLIDGDVIGNFPCWRFDNYLISNTKSGVIELRLENLEKPRKISNPIDYFLAVLDSAYNVSSDVLTDLYGQNNKYDVVRIDVGNTNIIDFNLSAEDREKLIEKGFCSVKRFFTTTLIEKKKRILDIYIYLEKFHNALLNEISAGKITKARIALGDLALFVYDNQETISKDILLQINKIREIFQKNLKTVMLLNITTLKNKEQIIKTINSSLKSIDDEIENLKYYLANNESLEKDICSF